MTTRTVSKCNAYQTAAATVYGGGDFYFVVDPAELEHAGVEDLMADCGDTLFQFVMRELAAKDMTKDEALRRMAVALRDVQTVIDAIERVEG